ncbi:MAG: GGDEF domain-containing protein [Candidatus Eremiobacteraeota bacterium]|nr:GGDEF domain-containing protein [Candidatus Eremiobacteraeota bacterium]
MLACAVGIFAYASPSQFARWSHADWVTHGVLLAMFAVLLQLGVPFLAFRNFGQREGDQGRICFDVPLYAVSFAVFGWFDTALLSFLSHLLTTGSARRYTFTERLLVASTRVPFFCLAGLMRPVFGVLPLQLSAAGFGAFFIMNALWIAAFILVWFDSLTALRTGNPLRSVWRLHVRDGVLWALFAAQIVWGYISSLIFVRDGAILGIATLLPLVLFAAILRALHQQRLSVHRLTLARDAVQAMLGARDPLPHINSILSSVHSELIKETLQILVYAGTGSDVWQSVTSLGPAPDDAAQQVRRHAIRGLIESDRNSSSASSREHAVVAFAARDSLGRLLGVLAVHRPAGAEQQMHRRQFETAAAALAPLLRDFRSIAATQNAAAIDTLTGLANRRTILETLRHTMDSVTVGASCAIVILDIDHFKNVNDQLGHQAGDRCLQLVGFVIANNIRGCDRAGRIGGEEFIVLMPEAGREVALVIGERLREAIEKSGFRHADGKPVTASIGVAWAIVSDTTETLIERADKALYEAKRYGRNRVVDLPA